MRATNRQQRRAFLDDVDLFASLDGDARSALGEVVEDLEVPGGQVLMKQGDQADCLYLVLSGRLSARVDRGDGISLRVGEVARGEVVGEMALITGEPRSATVVAERDSHLLRLPTAAFDSLIASDPASLRAIAGQVVERMRRGLQQSVPHSTVRTVAIVPLQAGGTGSRVADELTSALLGQGQSGVAVAAPDLEAAIATPGPPADDDTAVSQWMADLEDNHDLVLYRGDADASWWTTLVVRQADLLVLVADARSSGAATEAERLCIDRRRSVGTRTALVVAHPASVDEPRHTRRWLDKRDVDAHHHVRAGRAEDAARAARLLLGTGTALVLSGGGARGMAEIGVVKAMQELGIPIDAVAGTSAGALVGAAVARGWGADRISDAVRAGVIGDGRPVDPTFPIVSLASGRRVTERIKAAAEGLDIEDSWLPYFCVSTNLSRKQACVHRRGPAWRAIRASFAIPGVFPPVPVGDDVLVDGGMLDNLPVAKMRAEHPGVRVIAVDVGAHHDLHASGLPESCVVSGWGALATRVGPWRRETEILGIMRILTRLTELGAATDAATDAGDVLISPPVQHMPILDFSRFDEFVELGYKEAVGVLGKWQAQQPTDEH